jgi:hypothetical protein
VGKISSTPLGKVQIIHAIMQRMPFTVPMFTKLAHAQRSSVDTFYTKFYPNAVENQTARIKFHLHPQVAIQTAPLIGITLRSSIPNFTQIGHLI